MPSHLTPTADCCGAPASHQIVWKDDTESMLTCLDHFGHTYALAEQENAGRTSLPVHVSRIDELVGA